MYKIVSNHFPGSMTSIALPTCNDLLDLLNGDWNISRQIINYKESQLCATAKGTAAFYKQSNTSSLLHENVIVKYLNNINLPNIHYYKPYIIKDSIENGLLHGYYIESDDIITPFCDNLYYSAIELDKLPIFDETHKILIVEIFDILIFTLEEINKEKISSLSYKRKYEKYKHKYLQLKSNFQ